MDQQDTELLHFLAHDLYGSFIQVVQRYQQRLYTFVRFCKLTVRLKPFCAQAPTWLVSPDEKTSIQAREGEQPPRPAFLLVWRE